jgi:hypothetical protein
VIGRRLAIAVEMTLRRLLRNRLAVALLVLVPLTFQGVMLHVAPRRSVEVELSSVPETEMLMPPVRLLPRPLPPGERRGAVLEAPARSFALLHVSLSAVGVLAAFLGLTLIQRDAGSSQRLVLCGMRPSSLLAANLVALLLVVLAMTGIAAVLLLREVHAVRPAVVVLGLLLSGWVYGCYGLLVGTVFRTGLAGMLCVVLLANLDVIWLQNPIDYAEATTRWLIRALPGHGPVQVGLLGAFEEFDWAPQAIRAAGFGALFLLAAAAVFGRRTRVHRHTPAASVGAGRAQQAGGTPP